MTLHSLKLSKTFKTPCCQQHWLKFLNHGTLDEKCKNKPPLLPMIVINRFEKSCGTFKGKERKNSLSSTTLGQLVKINK
jgi:hypothetical protein